jgi:hypothetical protein
MDIVKKIKTLRALLMFNYTTIFISQYVPKIIIEFIFYNTLHPDIYQDVKMLILGIIFTDLFVTSFMTILLTEMEENKHIFDSEIKKMKYSRCIKNVISNEDNFILVLAIIIGILIPIQNTAIGLCGFIYLTYIYSISFKYVIEFWFNITGKSLRFQLSKKYHKITWTIVWCLQLIILCWHRPTYIDSFYLFIYPIVLFNDRNNPYRKKKLS